jgi:hypothetical protein
MDVGNARALKIGLRGLGCLGGGGEIGKEIERKKDIQQ